MAIAILKHPQWQDTEKWKSTMRICKNKSDKKKRNSNDDSEDHKVITPMRMLIEHMPGNFIIIIISIQVHDILHEVSFFKDIAHMVLTSCLKTNGEEHIYDYEFINDYVKAYQKPKPARNIHTEIELCPTDEIDLATTSTEDGDDHKWGPKKYSSLYHPLSLMVCWFSTNLCIF